MSNEEIELWDLYDQQRLLTGESHPRGIPLPKDRYHLVAHICIFNQQNQLLIQQRQVDKQGYPNMWDVSAAGSAIQGETSQQAAEREVAEELGLTLDLSHERPRLTINFPEGFDDYWLIERDVNLEDLTLQESEVQAVRWATEAEVLALAAEGQFIPYFFLNNLFWLKDNQHI